MAEIVSPQVLAAADELATRFRARDPFRHVVIDGFLEESFCAELLKQFPPFERGNARNEAGEVGDKATIEHIRGLGTAFAELDDLVQTQEFLELVGRITGIDGLLYDPWYFGGGTHENRAGQELDVHVDFNRHPVENWHRRLNLIVYLNPRWDQDWGGELELHSDPRAPDDRVTRIAPLFNRAVIFETTEWSWHGFPRICLPVDSEALSRKSIALYFYSRERPTEELADTHSTIYVDRPLPAQFVPGRALGTTVVDEVRNLVDRRDQHIQRLYRDLTSLTTQLEDAQKALYAGRLGRLRFFVSKLSLHLRRLRR
ncbi:MAG: 2OG-Fe(II) oxygenase [Rudaea sp.]